MKRSVLRLVAKNYVLWVHDRLPPSGRPALHDLEARTNELIKALPDGGGPDVGTVETLDGTGVTNAVEWLFTSLAKAYSADPWAVLAVHAHRLLALQAVPDVLAACLAPEQTLAQPH